VFAVVLGLLALLVGPVLGPVMRGHVRIAAGIDGFVVVTVVGLVILHVLPQSVAFAGAGALVVAALGVVAPVLLHRFDARMPARSSSSSTARQWLTTSIFLAGAFMHALLDGVALIDSGGHDHGHHHDESSISMLALAVLLHRLPYGLAIWVVGRERMGTARAVAVLASLGAGTIVGAVVGERVFTVVSVSSFALVQAFAAGAVLHVLLDEPAFDIGRHPRSSLLGVVAGLVVLVVLAQSHPVVAVIDDELGFGRTLFSMAAQTAPAVVVSCLLLGTLTTWGPRLRLALRGSGNVVLQAVSGVVAGVPEPMCTCTVVPGFERLTRRRVGLAAAAALLVSGPELAFAPVLMGIGLLGPQLTLARLLGAVSVAVCAGVVASKVARAPDVDDGELDDPALPFRAATLQAADHLLPWVLLGLVFAAFCEPLLSPTALSVLPRALEVPVFGVLGAPLYLCASGSTPVAAVLLHKGASAGAVVAFLLSGPVTNIATLGVVSRLYSRRVAMAFAAAVFIAATCVGWCVNVAVDAGLVTLPSLHEHAIHAHGAVEIGAVVVVAVLLGLSLARQGARGFLGQLLRPLDDAKGGHVHGPHCGHVGYARPGFVKKAPVARVRIDVSAPVPPPAS
jgi:uncharacterized membrane protein YraQ (UPF0718 family)